MSQQLIARRCTLLFLFAGLAPTLLALVVPPPRHARPAGGALRANMAAVELGVRRGSSSSSSSSQAAAEDGAFREGDPRLQVVVDIDDTVKSSGGATLAGIPLGGVDTQYARGAFYPGVFRFLLALSKHELPAGAAPLNVAVLTARAQELKWALQLKPSDPLCQALAACGVNEGYPAWGFEKVMYGSVREWVLQDLKGWRKYENFKLLRCLYPAGEEPESFVFVGDTGELDKEAGMRMLTSKSSAHKVKAVFLHVVSFAPGPVVVPPDGYINGKPVVHFRTYAGAAYKACQHHLLQPTEACEVVLECCRALRAADDANPNDPAFPGKWMDLQADISAAMAAFPDSPLSALNLADLAPRTFTPARAKLAVPATAAALI